MCRCDLYYAMTYINIGKSTHIWWICLFTHSKCIHSFYQCLLRAYYVPGIILNIWDMTMRKTGQVSSLVEF